VYDAVLFAHFLQPLTIRGETDLFEGMMAENAAGGQQEKHHRIPWPGKTVLGPR